MPMTLKHGETETHGAHMKRLITVLLLIALCPLQACMWYSAEAIEAWVVDAETNKPIEGVIVVAHWQLYGGLHPDDAGELTILETVTDKAGRFHFPAWGPKSLPAGSPSNARLAYMDPEILLFKSGFKYQRVANEMTTEKLKNAGPSLRRSEWNGKTIKMETFKGALDEYADLLSRLTTSLGFAYNGKNCEWRLLPRMIAAQHEEKQRLKEHRLFGALSMYSVENLGGQEKCGLAIDFFRDYLK